MVLCGSHRRHNAITLAQCRGLAFYAHVRVLFPNGREQGWATGGRRQQPTPGCTMPMTYIHDYPTEAILADNRLQAMKVIHSVSFLVCFISPRSFQSPIHSCPFLGEWVAPNAPMARTNLSLRTSPPPTPPHHMVAVLYSYLSDHLCSPK